jgi:hypothetical protein
VVPLADQRGFLRILTSADIGAYEAGAEALTIENIHLTADGTAGGTPLTGTAGGTALSDDITLAEANAGKMTVIYLHDDIDAVTTATYGTRTRGGTQGKGIWVTIDGQGYAIDGKDVVNTALRFQNNDNTAMATRNVIVLRNLTLKNMKSGDGTGTNRPNGSTQFNYGGGAIGMYGGELYVQNCTFEDNENEGLGNNSGGGAIFIQRNGRLKISDSTFTGNIGGSGTTPRRGGAIHANVPISITNTVFSGNRSGQGGAIAVTATGGSLEVDSASSFTNNTASQSGGAIHLYGVSGNNYFASPITATVDATFSGNTDDLEGAATDNYVLSAYYAPTFTGIVTDDKTDDSKLGSLTVGGINQGASFFADTNRTAINKVIPVTTHQELKNALGYVKWLIAYDDWERIGNGDTHPKVTPGIAEAGDVVVINDDILYNNDTGSTIDGITGATVYVTKDVSIFGNGYTINGKSLPVFDIDGGREDPAVPNPVTANVTNLRIFKGGYGTKLGGAVFVEGDGHLILNNATFDNCFANAGVGVEGATIAGGGGAVYLDPHGSGVPKLTATGSTFTNNRALMGTGGAISALNGEVTLTNCTFENNEAAQGGAVGLKGDGIFNLGTGNTFTHNKATYAGGAIDIHYGRSWYKRSDAMNVNSTIDTTINAAITADSFTDNEDSLGAVNIAYSRYYDENFPADEVEPMITGGEDVADLYDDLTFSDIYRTWLVGTPGPGDDDDDDDDDDGGTPGPGDGDDGGDDDDTPAPGDDDDDDDTPGGTPPAVVNPVTPGSDGSVNVTVPVKDENGNTVNIVEIQDNADNEAALSRLEEIGLTAEVSGGALVIDGTAVDIGTVTLDVVLSDGETTTVTFTVNPLPAVATASVSAIPSQWTGNLSTTASGSAFTIYVPVNLTASEAALITRGVSTSVNVTFSGPVTSHSEKLVVSAASASSKKLAASAEGSYIEITGSTTDADAVTADKVTYRVGIHQYQQTLGVALSSANLERETDDDDDDDNNPPTDNDPPTDDDDPSSDGTGKSSGGGCDAGFGAFSFAGLALIALTKTGRKSK